MNFSNYFDSIDINQGDLDFDYHDNHFAHKIKQYQNQNLADFDIAIIGVGEERGANNEGCAIAPNHVRKYLYRLAGFDTKIVDLGNLKIGATVEDTYFALSKILEDLIKKRTLPIIIGGSQDLTYANFLAYEHQEQTVNLVSVDAKFDILLTLSSKNFILALCSYLTSAKIFSNDLISKSCL